MPDAGARAGRAARYLERVSAGRGAYLVPAAVATTTSLAFLGRKSFWLDESYSFVAADRDLADLLRLFVRDESNMSPYYLGLHFWLELGRSEAHLRLLSVPFFVAAVVVVVALARRLFGPPTALVTGVLLAVSVMGVHYAQEARAYTLVLLAASLSMLLFTEIVLRPRRGVAVLWVLVTALGVYAHYFVALCVLVQVASLGFRPDTRVQLRRLAPAVVLLGVLVAPIAFFIPGRGTGPLASTAAPGVLPPARLLYWFTGSVPLGLLMGALVVLGTHASLRTVRTARRSGDAWPHALVLLWLVLPPGLVLLASFVQPLWAERYLFLCLPAFLMLVTRGLLHVRRPRVRAAVVVALVPVLLLALGAYYVEPVKWGADWRSGSAYVQAMSRPGDGVLFSPGKGHVPFAYYAWRRSVPPVQDLSIAPEGLRSRIHPRQLPRRLVVQNVQQRQRVWVVTKPSRVSRGAQARNARAERRVQEALRGFEPVSSRDFGPSLQVRLYVKRPG